MPAQGFNKIIRISYWMNAYNPIGPPSATLPNIAASDLYYSATYGWGPDINGLFLGLHRTTSIYRSSNTIVLADGVYMGRQSVTQNGQNNSRIGYRHIGPAGFNTVANVGFADGHVESIDGAKFPRALSASDSAAVKQQKAAENLPGPTIYDNPMLVFH